MIGSVRLDIMTCPLEQLIHTTSVSLTFTTQKNGVQNEIIRQGRSGDPYLCPVLALVRRIRHLRNNGAQPHTPLACVFTPAGTESMTPTLITKSLRLAVKFIGMDLGFLPEEVSARSLRAAGPWPSLLARLIQTSFAFLDAGVPMKYSDTCT